MNEFDQALEFIYNKKKVDEDIFVESITDLRR
jgi:hypothetical protein